MKIERQLLQMTIGILCLSPLLFGSIGIARGLVAFGQHGAQADADSHFRYLSGIFLMLAPLALSTVPRIETRAGRDRLLLVVLLVAGGGLGRLYGVAAAGVPSAAHLAGLATELGVTPALGLWAWWFQRRWARASRPLSEPG